MKVNIEISELVFQGFQRGKVNTAELAKDIESELTELIASKGLPTTLRMQGGDMGISDQEAHMAQIPGDIGSFGASIARSIYNNLEGKR